MYQCIRLLLIFNHKKTKIMESTYISHIDKKHHEGGILSQGSQSSLHL